MKKKKKPELSKVEKAMIEERHKYYDQMKPISWPTSYKQFGRNLVVT